MVFSNVVRFFFIVNSKGFIAISVILMLAEVILCTAIIWNIPYTEIDWSTYMQQVECYLNGTYDYSLINGSTGPIVYPAGHLLIYRLLYALTDKGLNIRRAQYIFEALYMANLLAVFAIYYRSSKIPPFVLIPLCTTSYRIHSIFLLRLFNDPIAMFLFYVGVNLWLNHYWIFGSLFYSLAVSVKMNILLFAPAVFFIFLLHRGIRKTIKLLFFCGLIQIAVALPFLMHDSLSYLKRSFDLGRVFLFEWTVNWRFLSESGFLDKRFHLLLLILHAVLLIIFAGLFWFRDSGGLPRSLLKVFRGIGVKTSTNDILFALFTANFIGIAVARSLHYQFYIWYFHSLPYLLFSSIRSDHENKSFFAEYDQSWLSIILRLSILFGMELCWNTYPSTPLSSGMLHVLHLCIFIIVVLDERSRSQGCKYKEI
ncbi:unnamed protein product [Dracunculus medinensis]|uniref:dolichyl-P-Man:Man5GlcNAc2-PP-dolichol alpha-1,3-mannosyltransferase n=1 Tax=Dracunculus medinensis TaxID=318479 RepID=A0A0N4UK69_DRAME|nr:unnamed protein product [Dracunculus medinensis]